MRHRIRVGGRDRGEGGAAAQRHALLESHALPADQPAIFTARQERMGPDQCLNDSDRTVDHNERLRITGLAPGRYDAKLTDKIGRTCVIKDVTVKENVFTIEETQLTDCRQR